jgi:glycosyltransferase involved in cell wall biosynthesis
LRRILICGPVFTPGTVGGLPVALQELADQLTRFGWAVDLAVTPDTLGIEGVGLTPVLPGWGRRVWTPTSLAARLPADGRAWIQHVLLGGGVAAVQSRVMDAIERRLASADYEAVVAYVSRETPGFAAFITSRHPRVLLLSLNGLAAELRQGWRLRVPRFIARVHGLHTDLYRPMAPSRVRMAAFGSEAWRDEAVAAGLPEAAARVIPFGVTAPPPLGPMPPVNGRLLWVGRCSPEKGLHLFLDALALLRRSMAVTLTAICGPGPSGYRRFIERRIVELGIGDTVTLRPAVRRADLGTHYMTHDALLFQSPFDEPVSLVLMEAFAAGIPVVAPAPAGRSALIEPDHTCVCYKAPRAADVAAAVERSLSDSLLRVRVRTGAHARVSRDFSLDAMGQAYDFALRDLMRHAPQTAGHPR